MGKSKPKTPDYTALADKTFEHDKEMLDEQTQANRPNQSNPFGEVTWDKDAQGNWTQNTTLNPLLQQQLQNQMQSSANMSDLGSGMFGSVAQSMGDKFDFGQFGDQAQLQYNPDELRQKAEDTAYQSATSRLDPQYEQQQAKLENDLRNRGLMEGDSAFDTAMQNFQQGKTDAYQQAQNQAFQAGQGEAQQLYGQQMGTANYQNQLRQQAIAEALKSRYMPLSDMQQLLGSQVQSPNFGGFSQAGNIGGADYLNAGMMQSNADQAKYQQQQQGLGNLAQLGMAGAMMFSDRRLKRNIARIGSYNGYPLYEYDYVWGVHAVGVMSDEVNQDAVHQIGGYDVVDYSEVK